MKLNRREFIASSAMGAAASHLVPELRAQQATRTLSIVFHGLSIIAVGRGKHEVGLPGSTARVDVLYVSHPDHETPRLFYGSGSFLDLAQSDLQILIDGKPVTASGVQLEVSDADICPINGLDWSNLRRVPEFERILQTEVTVKPAALAATPAMVSGRFTMRAGTLSGHNPKQPYDGDAWKFPGGDINYVRAFTDTFVWNLAVPDNVSVGCCAQKFGAKAPGTPVDLGKSGNILVYLRARRADQTPLSTVEDQITHFAHYYPLLDYAGGKTPIPTRVPQLCKTVPLTDQQEKRQLFINGIQSPVKPQDDDCLGAAGEEVFRGEPGICENGIAFAEFK